MEQEMGGRSCFITSGAFGDTQVYCMESVFSVKVSSHHVTHTGVSESVCALSYHVM